MLNCQRHNTNISHTRAGLAFKYFLTQAQCKYFTAWYLVNNTELEAKRYETSRLYQIEGNYQICLYSEVFIQINIIGRACVCSRLYNVAALFLSIPYPITLSTNTCMWFQLLFRHGYLGKIRFLTWNSGVIIWYENRLNQIWASQNCWWTHNLCVFRDRVKLK